MRATVSLPAGRAGWGGARRVLFCLFVQLAGIARIIDLAPGGTVATGASPNAAPRGGASFAAGGPAAVDDGGGEPSQEGCFCFLVVSGELRVTRFVPGGGAGLTLRAADTGWKAGVLPDDDDASFGRADPPSPQARAARGSPASPVSPTKKTTMLPKLPSPVTAAASPKPRRIEMAVMGPGDIFGLCELFTTGLEGLREARAARGATSVVALPMDEVRGRGSSDEIRHRFV